ncbi:hypothetical protein I204_03792 [Kwoniella mangroviensis CBS 8886]|nr:hypothetical protein I204_03792 [Kwoniella mangroviensis CBS 8886]
MNSSTSRQPLLDPMEISPTGGSISDSIADATRHGRKRMRRNSTDEDSRGLAGESQNEGEGYEENRDAVDNEGTDDLQELSYIGSIEVIEPKYIEMARKGRNKNVIDIIGPRSSGPTSKGRLALEAKILQRIGNGTPLSAVKNHYQSRKPASPVRKKTFVGADRTVGGSEINKELSLEPKYRQSDVYSFLGGAVNSNLPLARRTELLSVQDSVNGLRQTTINGLAGLNQSLELDYRVMQSTLSEEGKRWLSNETDEIQAQLKQVLKLPLRQLKQIDQATSALLDKEEMLAGRSPFESDEDEDVDTENLGGSEK